MISPWRKSSRSMNNGNCAEVGVTGYRKSSHSVSGNCAEVGADGVVVGVRDTKDPDGTELLINGVSWGKFLVKIRESAGPP